MNHARFCCAKNTLVDAHGKIYPLRNQSLKVLQLLAEKPEKIVPKSTLHERVWPGIVVTDDSLVQCISEIRKALGDKNREILKTFARQGYLLSNTAFVNKEHANQFSIEKPGTRKISARILQTIQCWSPLTTSVAAVSSVTFTLVVLLSLLTPQPTSSPEKKVVGSGQYDYYNSKLNSISSEFRDRFRRRSPHGVLPRVNDETQQRSSKSDPDKTRQRYARLTARIYPERGMPYWNNRFFWDGYYLEDR